MAHGTMPPLRGTKDFGTGGRRVPVLKIALQFRPAATDTVDFQPHHRGNVAVQLTCTIQFVLMFSTSARPFLA
jgi:hypothetical protein